MIELPEEVRDLLEGPNFAHLATVLPDGAPHSVPLWIGVEGEHIVFFAQVTSVKGRNIERDPRVAISICNRENPYKAARIRGVVVDRRTGEEALKIVDRISYGYSGKPFRKRNTTLHFVEPTKASFIDLPYQPLPVGDAPSPS